MIHFCCPLCGHSLRAEHGVAGRPVACTRCHHVSLVPANIGDIALAPESVSSPATPVVYSTPPPVRPNPVAVLQSSPTVPAAVEEGDDELDSLLWAQQMRQRRRRMFIISVSCAAVPACALAAVLIIAAQHEKPALASAKPDSPPTQPDPDPIRPNAPFGPQDPAKPPQVLPPRRDPGLPLPILGDPENPPHDNQPPAAPPQPNPFGPGNPHADTPKPVQPQPPARPPEKTPQEPSKPLQDNDDESPETRALITEGLRLLQSKSAAERIRGAEMLGKLGPKARRAARGLCKAMLDHKVGAAAADALKLVDRDLQALAVPLVVNAPDESVLLDTLQRIQALGHDAEPLVPIVERHLSLWKLKLPQNIHIYTPFDRAEQNTAACIKTLAAIAPDDLHVNGIVLSLLKNSNLPARFAAAQVVPVLKHAREALGSLKSLAKPGGADAVRLVAIEGLVSIVDKDNDIFIKRFLTSLRYDRSPRVRKAVEEALEHLNE